MPIEKHCSQNLRQLFVLINLCFFHHILLTYFHLKVLQTKRGKNLILTSFVQLVFVLFLQSCHKLLSFSGFHGVGVLVNYVFEGLKGLFIFFLCKLKQAQLVEVKGALNSSSPSLAAFS